MRKKERVISSYYTDGVSHGERLNGVEGTNTLERNCQVRFEEKTNGIQRPILHSTC